MRHSRAVWLWLVIAPLPAVAAPDDDPPLLANPVIAVSGGVKGFFTGSLRDVAQDGAAWNVRVSAGARAEVRLELSYTGSTQSLADTQGSLLVGHGLEAALRVNVAPWVRPLEPFVFLGGGWTRYSVRARRVDAMLRARDDVFEIPFGVGASRRFGRLVAEVRAGVQIASGADLLPIEGSASSSRDSALMHRFSANAGIGFEL